MLFDRITGVSNPFESFVAIPGNFDDVNSAFGDLDNDGDFDMFLTKYAGNVEYWENTGSATAPVLTQRTGAANPMNGLVHNGKCPKIAIGDMDNDLDLDLWIGGNDGTVQYFKNTGNPASPVFERMTGGNNPLEGISFFEKANPSLHDEDGDGDLDIIVTNQRRQLQYFENIGTSSLMRFATATNFPLAKKSDAKPGRAPHLVWEDTDNDGDDDLFLGTAVSEVMYYENTGSSSSPVYEEKTGSSNPMNMHNANLKSNSANCRGVDLVDMDGDGDLDMVVGCDLGKIHYFERNACNQDVFCNGRGMCMKDLATPICDCNSLWSGAQCESCPLGSVEEIREGGDTLFLTYTKAPTCFICPAGKWSDASGYTAGVACTPCLSGRFGQKSASNSLSTGCSSCPVGFTQPDEGATNCDACRPGFYKLETMSSTPCVECLAGFYQENGGFDVPDYTQGGCIRCGVGRFQNQAGKSLCKDCLPGSFNDQLSGITECKLCEVNTFSADLGRETACIACKTGKTAAEGSTTCTDCLAGTFENINRECEACASGKYSDDSNAQICKNCGAGKYVQGGGKTACVPCLPGKHGRADSATRSDCEDCAIGTASDVAGLTTPCASCGAGRAAVEGLTKCSDCLAGTFENINRECEACASGKYSDDSNAQICKNCGAGKYQSDVKKTSCLPCIPGRYNDQVGQINCTGCLVNTFAAEAGRSTICEPCAIGTKASPDSAKCTKCDAGEAGTGRNGTCEQCRAGHFRGSSDDSMRCRVCPAGYAAGIQGSTVCIKCQRGKFVSKKGQSECETCPGGWLQIDEGQSNCTEAQKGTIILGGGTSSVVVPLGSFIKADGSDFEACTAGTKGNKEKSECTPCPAGKTSFAGSMSCIPCGKGKFSVDGGQLCLSCPKGYYQPQENKPSSHCFECPTGWSQDEEGSESCKDLYYVNADDCEFTTEYLNDTSRHQRDWYCVPCPRGGACGRNSTVSKGVVPLFGWASCSKTNSNRGDKFDSCQFGAACLGGANPALLGKYTEENLTIVEQHSGQSDPSMWCPGIDGNSIGSEGGNVSTAICKNGCNTAYTSGSRMCSTCSNNYSRSGSRCDACPPFSQNLMLGVIGCLLGVVGMIVVVFLAFSDQGTLNGSDGIKLTLMSTLQMLSLFRTFPIAWPSIFSQLFHIGGAVVVLGQHFVNIKCLMDGLSDLDIFYTTAVTWAVAPIALVIVCSLAWIVIKFCCFRSMTSAHIASNTRTSLVALLYLIHPTLCEQTFALFSCRSVCGENEQWLRVSLDEQCWTGRHLFYVYIIALPMMLIYVFGLPFGAWFACYRVKLRAMRSHRTMTSPRRRRSTIREIEMKDEAHHTYGALYSMYKPRFFWWEGTVVFRKILIALVATFGSSLGLLQVHIGLMILAVFILFTAVVRPYDDAINSSLLMNVELGGLATMWLTLWAGSIFNTYPRCEVSGGVLLDHDGFRRFVGGTAGRQTYLWCDVMSLAIGGIDIFGICILFLLFLREKGMFEVVRKRCCVKRVQPEEKNEANQIEPAHEHVEAKTKKSPRRILRPVVESPAGKIARRLETGEMVGSPLRSPNRKMLAVALPSPTRLGKKFLAVGDYDTRKMKFDHVMWGDTGAGDGSGGGGEEEGGAMNDESTKKKNKKKKKKSTTVITALGKGIILSTRDDGTQVVQLEWNAIMYRKPLE